MSGPAALRFDTGASIRRRTPALCWLCIQLSGAALATEISLGPPPWDLRPHVRWSLQTVASMYEASHSDTIVHVTVGLDPFDATTVEAEDLGDVMFIPGAEYGQASILGILVDRGLCLDLTERVQDPAFAKEDFYPNLWDLVTCGNQTWAIPLMVRSWGLAVDTRNADAARFKRFA